MCTVRGNTEGRAGAWEPAGAPCGPSESTGERQGVTWMPGSDAISCKRLTMGVTVGMPIGFQLPEWTRSH